MPIIEEISPGEEASDLKEKGNAECRKGDHAAAEATFSLALSIDGLQDEKLRGLLHCNRAHVRLKLFDAIGALEDAEAALQLDASMDKAAFRKGRAEFLLGRYTESSLTYQKLKESASDPALRRQAADEQTNALARFREQSSGEYDFCRLFDLDLGVPAEVAEYVGPIKVDQVPGKGRGIVVTRDVPAGELLFANRALFLAKTKLFVDVAVAKLRSCSPAQHRAFFLLSDGKSTPEELPSLTVPLHGICKHDRNVDKAKVRAILSANAHELDSRSLNGSTESGLSGFFLIASLVNHSCLPSATRHFFGDMMFVRAARQLCCGEEVTDGYISVLHPSFERRSMLSDRYGFDVFDDRALVEDSLMPESLVKPILRDLDRLADLDGFESLAAKVRQLARDRVMWLGRDAPEAVKVAASRLNPRLENLLCASLMPVFLGVALLCKSSGRLAQAAIAYALCCRFMEEAAPHNAYHAAWALDALSCAASVRYQVEQFGEYARKVIRVHYGPDLFSRVLAREGVTSCVVGEQLDERALPPGSMQYWLTMKATSVQLVVVVASGVRADDVEVSVSAYVVHVKIADEQAVIVLPCSVIVEAAAAVRFLKKHRQILVDVPIAKRDSSKTGNDILSCTIGSHVYII